MEYEKLKELCEEYRRRKEDIPQELQKELEFEFTVEFTYNSCRLSGNTLTKDEVREILRQYDEGNLDLTME